MAQVYVTVNGRSYQIACDDGQEHHIERLGQYVDRRVQSLVASVGQVGDARLLLMASLLIAGEFADATAELGKIRAASGATEKSIAAEVEAAAARIEALAARLAGYPPLPADFPDGPNAVDLAKARLSGATDPTSPGPISTSRELSLPRLRSRYMAPTCCSRPRRTKWIDGRHGFARSPRSEPCGSRRRKFARGSMQAAPARPAKRSRAVWSGRCATGTLQPSRFTGRFEPRSTCDR